MDTQLSRFRRSMTVRPCRSSFAPFDGTISSERVAHTSMQPTPTHARLLGEVLGVVVVLVGRQPSGAAEAPAVMLHFSYG
jgi:hypothetical protein